jgi:DNA polymerase-1
MYKPGRGGNPAEIMGVKEVCEKFEISNPAQVIDILGLWGDASDNIPGIPGIGEKTAKVLVAKYGSMEGLFAHVHELKGKQKENVENFQQQGLMSKSLATIIRDVPVEFDEKDLEICPVNAEAIKDIFTELEFRTLAKRVIGEEIVVTQAPASKEEAQLDLFGMQSMLEPQEAAPTANYKTIATEKPSYHLITSAEERKELLALLLVQSEVCFDTETTSIDALHFTWRYPAILKAQKQFFMNLRWFLKTSPLRKSLTTSNMT